MNVTSVYNCKFLFTPFNDTNAFYTFLFFELRHYSINVEPFLNGEFRDIFTWFFFTNFRFYRTTCFCDQLARSEHHS